MESAFKIHPLSSPSQISSLIMFHSVLKKGSTVLRKKTFSGVLIL